MQIICIRKKNNYTIWGQTNNIYNLCKSCTLLSSFVVWACVFALMLFPVFGLGLSFFAMCFLCIGFKKNVLDCLQKKPIKVESVFNYFKYSISAFCLKVCSLVLIILWSLLLIVPGIIACLNYSFAPYIFINDPKIGTIECLERSKKLTYGYRSDIFLVYLFAILILILIAVLSFSLVLIFNFMVKPNIS